MSVDPLASPLDQAALLARLAARIEAAEGPLERVRTHISELLLTPQHAYKLKRALDLGFVDFRAAAARRQACEDELRLNRRTAPGLYLRMAGVDAQGCFVAPDAAGAAPGAEPVDYVVCMRRFAPGSELSALLSHAGLSPARVDELAAVVAGFHLSLPPLRDGGFGSPEAVRRAGSGQADELLALARDDDGRALAKAWAQWSAREEARLAPVFAQRRAAGFVREAHGDLHLGNICLFDGRVTLFDGLEFDAALRCIDQAADLAFLLMDLQARGAAGAAWRVLNGWLELTADFGALAVLRYYQACRAVVRLKVAWLGALLAASGAASRAAPGPASGPAPGVAPEAAPYAALLGSLMAPPPPAAIVITHGVSGSGKTWLARALCEHIGAVHMRSDIERHRTPDGRTGTPPDPQPGLHTGLQPSVPINVRPNLHPSAHPNAPPAAKRDAYRDASRDANRYAPAAIDSSYQRLARLATAATAQGWPVVVDATFLDAGRRAQWRALARELGRPFAIAHCAAPPALLRQRVAARLAQGRDASEADLAVLQQQLGAEHELRPEEADAAVTVWNDSDAPDAAAARVHQAAQQLVALLAQQRQTRQRQVGPQATGHMQFDC